MTGQDPGRLLLDKIDAREQALAREAEQARTLIGDLAARLREPGEAIDHLRITRKTLLSLASEPATEPAEPPPYCPGSPNRARYRHCIDSVATSGPGQSTKEGANRDDDRSARRAWRPGR